MRVLALSFLALSLLSGTALANPVLPADGPKLTIDGLSFRDLNRDGTLNRYEDWRLSPEVRAADLVARMRLEEKAGAATHGTAPVPGGVMAPGPAYDLDAARTLILGRHVTSMISRMAIKPADFAAENNKLQAIAADGRLGIPMTISSDPRSHFQETEGASVAVSGFSQWPEPIGLGAIDDPALTRQFAAIVRAEYRAVGIAMALSPQADLATEPRWPRINGTFGEDPDRVAAQVTAYVQGMQGADDHLAPDGVAVVIKHWAGYGAEIEGFDAHNYYGRFTDFTAGHFDLHVKPWLGAFAAGAAAVMPTYTIQKGLVLDGKPVEPVGGGFSKELLTGLLRGTHGFKGMVLSDWSITSDCPESCRTGNPPQQPRDIGNSWGMEDRPAAERYAKALEAGIDQFGGVDDGTPIVSVVRQGLVKEAVLDRAVERIMELKFRLGLFENPFVDPVAAGRIVGAADKLAAGRAAQVRSLVVLENRLGSAPLRPGAKLHLYGVDPAVARAAGFDVVDGPGPGVVSLLRLVTPWQVVHPNHFFGKSQHEGDIDFKPDHPGLAAVQAAAKAGGSVIVLVQMDRPAIVTSLKPLAGMLIAGFGITDAALFDALTGKGVPKGKLPFELPSSMEAVRAQSPALPHDSHDPLYPIGFAGAGR